MLEVGINQRWEEDGAPFVRNVGLFRVDENDPAAPVEVLQPVDTRSLAAVMKVLRDMAKDQRKAVSQFGEPAA